MKILAVNMVSAPKVGMMKGYKYIYPASLLILLILAIIAFANPTADLQTPTEANNTYLNRNYTFINISTNESAADYVLLEWNGTNVTIDSPQLVLNMHFDENSTASGGVKDKSRYGNNGTATGSPYFNTSGKFGSAWNFDGSNDYILVTDSPSLRLNDTTISFWYFINRSSGGAGTYRNLVMKSNDWWATPATWGVHNIDASPGNIYFMTRIDSGTAKTLNYDTGLSTGWIHITVTKSGTNGIIYINGIQQATGTLDANTTAADGSLYIGGGTERVAAGLIDEVRIYNRALSAAEINASYKAELGKYNTTQFFANFTDLNDGQYNYVTIINNTAGAVNRSQARIINIGGFAVNLLSPTDSNNTYLNRNFTFLNISSNDPNIDSAIVEWNGTNVTIDSPQLVLDMKFGDAYYNVSSKNVTDNSRYGNNGTYAGEGFNNGTLVGAVRNSSGKYGSALSFDGADDYVDAGSGTSLNFNGQSFTAEAWINSADNTGDAIFGRLDWPVSGWRGWNVYVQSDGSVAFLIGNGTSGVGGTSITAASLIQTGQWYHIASVFNGSVSRIFVDGVLKASASVTGFADPSVNTRIGDNDRSYFFNGTIDEVRIWNRVLDGNEINASMNSAYPVNRTGLVASWRFEEGSGNTAYDTHHQVAGRFGAAMSFDGVNDYVQVTSTSGDELNPSDSITVSAWFYLNSYSSAAQYIVRRWWPYELFVRAPSNSYQISLRTTGDNVLDTSISVPTQTWTFVTFTYNNSIVKLYENSVLKWSYSLTGTMAQSGTNVDIGATGGSYPFNGTIDEVRIYSMALSSGEINASYKAEFGKYNTTQFFANFTDLADGRYSYVSIINNTAGAINRSQERIVNIDVACSPPGLANWNISKACIFSGRNVSTPYNLTLMKGGNLTLINSNITFNSTNQYIIVNNRSQLAVNAGSRINGR